MVTVIDYKKNKNSNDEEFYSLVLQSGVEFVQSKETGNYYATVTKTTITSTFNEETCKALVGQKMPGRIVKVECEPYEYTIQDTGEKITLKHTHQFIPETPDKVVSPALVA